MKNRLIHLSIAALIFSFSTLAGAVIPVYIIGGATNTNNINENKTSVSTFKNTTTDATSHRYKLSIKDPKHKFFSGVMLLDNASLHNSMSETQQITYIKSFNCCVKNPKTGKKNMNILVRGVYVTGIDISMLDKNPDKLHVLINNRIASTLKLVGDQSNGHFAEIPIITAKSINTTLSLNKMEQTSFKFDDKILTIDEMIFVLAYFLMLLCFFLFMISY